MEELLGFLQLFKLDVLLFFFSIGVKFVVVDIGEKHVMDEGILHDVLTDIKRLGREVLVFPVFDGEVRGVGFVVLDYI